MATGTALAGRRVKLLRSPKMLAIMTLALGIALTGLGTAWQLKQNQEQASARFADLCRDVAGQVGLRMRIFEYGLRSARGVFIAAGLGQAGRKSFHDYSATRDIGHEFPGAQGFGIIRRIPSAGELPFVASSLSAGWLDFGIHPFQPQNGDRYVVQYIEPVAPNLAMVGIDIASDEKGRIAALASLRSAEATLTSPIASGLLAGAPGHSVLLLLPIYRPGAPVNTPAERESAGLGWSFAPLVMEDALNGLGGAKDQYTLTLSDSATRDTGPFFRSLNATLVHVAGLRQHLLIPMYGRSWEAELDATPAFLRQLDLPAPGHIGLVGLFVTALLGLLAYLIPRATLGKRLVLLDVTRHKEQERSLQETVDEARQANRAKSQFLAHMSHEIRTPLNAVIGLSHLLGRTAMDDRQADLLMKIRLASKSLLLVINDVLDLSKIEAGELSIERGAFDPNQLIEELSALMSVEAEAKGIALRVVRPDALPPSLEGDAMRLHQILTNLLSNAIKFTECGAVSLVVHVLTEAIETVRLRFEVEDSGIGIAPDALVHLFKPFVQADASTTRRFGGTGLGLSIVKQLVGIMGGELGVTSTPGVGSNFWIEMTFPISSKSVALADEARTGIASGKMLSGIRALLVDDSAINLEVARGILELEGARVRLATNGRAAVEALLAAPDGFDVVLMDVQMPVLGGLDASRRIRKGLGLTNLPIIALTAGSLASEEAEARGAGMNAFVTKPFDPQVLVGTIRRLVNRPPMVEGSEHRPARLGLPECWPEIPGIDSEDACRRLSRDSSLFRSMLKRLLADFADVSPGSLSGQNDLREMAARLHDLKGTAATLGAKSLARTAADAESACRDNQADQVIALTARVVRELQDLRHAVGTRLEDGAHSAPRDGSRSPGIPDPAALPELVRLLRQYDLRARECFLALSDYLRDILSEESYLSVSEGIDNLDYATAAEALEGAILAFETDGMGGRRM